MGSDPYTIAKELRDHLYRHILVEISTRSEPMSTAVLVGSEGSYEIETPGQPDNVFFCSVIAVDLRGSSKQVTVGPTLSCSVIGFTMVEVAVNADTEKISVRSEDGRILTHDFSQQATALTVIEGFVREYPSPN